MADQLEQLLREHGSAHLPVDCADLVVQGISLAELDRELTACIQAILQTGAFDHEQHIVLAVSLDKLSRVLSSLGQDASVYFGRLRIIALMVTEKLA